MNVDVVIPYYRDQPMLDRILASLQAQEGLDGAGPAGAGLEGTGLESAGLEGTGPVGAPRVIVADDGSPEPPRVPPGVTVVRQADEGFRASAARHLGARAGSGDILLFLDGDTVPGPGYVAALLTALADQPDLLVVGRRRYGRFAGTGPEVSAVLPDPSWPASFYAETDNLTRGDDLWRGVLSAAFGLHRRLYDLAGGFDPEFVGYGGEDWDLAWRCEQVGGRLLHVPDAVAWHDGPDWAGRATEYGGRHSAADPHRPGPCDGPAEPEDHLAEKNAETARLAPVIASPATRAPGGIFALPEISAHIHASGPAFAGSGSVAATIASVLTWGDVAVGIDPGSVDADLIAEMFAADPRVFAGPDTGSGPHSRWGSPDGQHDGPRRRPPVLVDIHHPCALAGLDARRLRALCPASGAVTLDHHDGRALATVRSARSVARDEMWGDAPPPSTSIPASSVGVTAFEPGRALRLEQALGGW